VLRKHSKEIVTIMEKFASRDRTHPHSIGNSDCHARGRIAIAHGPILRLDDHGVREESKGIGGLKSKEVLHELM